MHKIELLLVAVAKKVAWSALFLTGVGKAPLQPNNNNQVSSHSKVLVSLLEAVRKQARIIK